MAKVAVKVDRAKLVGAINQSATDAKTLGELWENAAEIYNLNEELEPVTKAVVMSRVKEFGLNVPELKANEVNKNLLAEAIKDAEKNGPLKNLKELWDAATAYYNSKSEHPITFSVAAARAKEFKLTFQTQPGKKGRGPLSEEQKALMIAARKAAGPRQPRSAKMGKFKETFQILTKEAPELRHGLIKKAEGGSIKAFIKLKCLDCANWQPAEITHCQCVGCPLFPVRPFQKSQKAVTEGEAEKVEAEEPETEEGGDE